MRNSTRLVSGTVLRRERGLRRSTRHSIYPGIEVEIVQTILLFIRGLGDFLLVDILEGE